jgi:hypothetical protein
MLLGNLVYFTSRFYKVAPMDLESKGVIHGDC